MPEQEEMRDSIRKGEERLAHSKSMLERLKSAEAATARLLNNGKVRKPSKV